MIRPIICFVTSALFILPSFVWAQGPEPNSWDGRWWLSISNGERTGYIDGDTDCYLFEAKGRVTNSDPIEDYVSFITRFYEKGPQTALKIPVVHLLRQMDKQPSKVRRAAGGEVWSEAHGSYDGLFWRQDREREKIGFIEGYRRCYVEAHGNKNYKFTKSSSKYMKLIDGWYYKTGKEEEKIADVLLYFRDQLPSKSR